MARKIDGAQEVSVSSDGNQNAAFFHIRARRDGAFAQEVARRRIAVVATLAPDASIGARVHELRVNDQSQTWRLFYRTDADAIVVVELLSKKTEQTPLATIRLCKKRLREYDEDVEVQKEKNQ